MVAHLVDMCETTKWHFRDLYQIHKHFEHTQSLKYALWKHLN